MSTVTCYFLIVGATVVQKSYPAVNGWVEGPEWVTPGYTYLDGEFRAPPPDYEANSTAQLTQLEVAAQSEMQVLGKRISVLQTAKRHNIITPDESTELDSLSDTYSAWELYTVYLSRVVNQAGWPQSPNWPAIPV